MRTPNEYIDKTIKYTVNIKEIDGNGIVDAIIIMRDKTKEKPPIIGYIGVRMVALYYDPGDTYVIADSLSLTLGQEIAFLLRTKEVKCLYDKKRNRKGYLTYLFNYIGHIYQFDLLEEYQGKGIEEYFLDNLGYIIQDKKKSIYMYGATFYIAGKNCDKEAIYIDFCRNRKFEAPIKEEAVMKCDRFRIAEWNGAYYSYAIYGTTFE